MASHVASDRSDETKVYMLNGNSTEVIINNNNI